MNLPNKITLLRVALIPVFAVLALAPIPYGDIWAAIIFFIAAISDAVDGNIARGRGLVTNFGKFADPLADKMLVGVAMVCLVTMGRLPAWVLIIILCREFIVDGLRMIAVEKGEVIAASKWGKLKTLFQMIMVIMLLISSLGFLQHAFYDILCWIVIIIAVALTLWSGFDYLRQGRRYII